MTDINATISAFKGWEYSARGYDIPEMELTVPYQNKVTGKFSAGCPDFKGDARLYMALFEEMPRPALRKWGNRWYCMPDMDRSSKVQWVEYDADTIGTAICLAYMQLHGLE